MPDVGHPRPDHPPCCPTRSCSILSLFSGFLVVCCDAFRLLSTRPMGEEEITPAVPAPCHRGAWCVTLQDRPGDRGRRKTLLPLNTLIVTS